MFWFARGKDIFCGKIADKLWRRGRCPHRPVLAETWCRAHSVRPRNGAGEMCGRVRPPAPTDGCIGERRGRCLIGPGWWNHGVGAHSVRPRNGAGEMCGRVRPPAPTDGCVGERRGRCPHRPGVVESWCRGAQCAPAGKRGEENKKPPPQGGRSFIITGSRPDHPRGARP